MYASCLVEYPVKTLDKAFTYKIPQNFMNKIKVGMKVLVPFNNRLVHGIVINILNEYHDNYELKDIALLEDEFLVLNKELLELGYFLKENTLCNLITAYQTMLPSSLKIKNQKTNYKQYEKYVSLKVDTKTALEFISTHKGKKCDILECLLDKKEVLKSNFDSASIRELERLGLIEIILKDKYRINKETKNAHDFILNSHQQQVFNIIKSSFSTDDTFLLYGVTGSGKTVCYINLIKEALKEGKTALLLVPEISLTEQIINIFYDQFGSDVAILHSGLSNGEKYDEYRKILNKEVRIVIGTRSAVFAPLENIGIIIIDEEHSDTYKQDSTPRYHARDIALERSKYHKCPLVLGSATPSLESMARAKRGVYKLVTLKARANNLELPKVTIIDMAKELKKRNFIISEELDKKIKEALKRQEQIILFLNRRGFSTIITCSNCGHTYKCPHCEISLTYHKTNNTLRCHYCGYTRIKDDICPICKEAGLNYLGMGTEKLESIINEKYPSARIIRMDRDTTSTKGAHDKILKKFRNGEADILIGTQMISKGLDFPNCTLVGIINADTSLNVPDFRSSERTFSLTSQASGRAGRGTRSGSVIIQTFNPEHYAIKCVKNHDYDAFYAEEMEVRKKLKYPPFYYLVNIKVGSKDYTKAAKNATKVRDYLKEQLDKSSIILGPSTSLNFKIKNVYRFNITIKYRFDKTIKQVLKNIDEIYSTNKDVFVEIDLNPLSL